jgi:hypothetical protein
MDACGNTSTCVQQFQLIDNTPPQLQVPADILTIGNASQGGKVINYSVTNNDPCDASPLLVCDVPSGSLFPCGMTTVTCVATDACGNSVSDNFNVSVTCPSVVINCPDPWVVVADVAPTVVDWGDPVIVDAGCGGISFAYSVDPGNEFPGGLNEVIATATDSCGNVGECTLEFTVITDTMTTVNELSDAYLQLYPNPSSSIVHVEHKQNMNIKLCQLFDPLGRLIKQQANSSPSPQVSIDLENLSDGTFILKVLLDDGTVIEQRLIKLSLE